MERYKYRGIWADPSNPEDLLLLIDFHELELIISGLSLALLHKELPPNDNRLPYLKRRLGELREQVIVM